LADAARRNVLGVDLLVVLTQRVQRLALLLAAVRLRADAAQGAGEGQVGGQAVPHAVAHRRADAADVAGVADVTEAAENARRGEKKKNVPLRYEIIFCCL